MQTIRDTRFATRYLIRNLAIFVPVAMALLLLKLAWGRNDLAFWLGLFVFATAIACWAWQDRHLLRSYHCPRCGSHLPRPVVTQRHEGDALWFRCARCDVLWDTTLRK